MACVYRTNTWVIPGAITESDSDPLVCWSGRGANLPFATTLLLLNETGFAWMGLWSKIGPISHRGMGESG